MIYIPFFYFGLLLVIILRIKRRFELSALITSAFLTTSFFAIIIDYMQLYGVSGCVKANIDFIPTFLYCTLVTLTIIPFTKLPPFQLNNWVSIRNMWLFNRVINFYWIIFLLTIFFFGNELLSRLQNPEIAALRIAYARGEDDLGFSNYSGVIRIFARLTFIIGSSAMFLQVLYFYSLAFLKRKRLYNIGILILSTIPVIISFLSFDRSKLIYWFMSFLALAVFFWPLLQQKRKKQMKFTFIFFLSIFIVYMSVITIARYGTQGVGASNSLIVYAGQSFNNFCLFYEKLEIDRLNFEKVTPLLNSIAKFFDNYSAPIRDYPIDTNVFASFIGMVMRDIGIGGTIIYCIVYSISATLIFKNIPKYNITKIFLIIIFIYIPYLGIFGLFYSSVDRVITVWLILILSYFLRKKVQLQPGSNIHFLNQFNESQ